MPFIFFCKWILSSKIREKKRGWNNSNLGDRLVQGKWNLNLTDVWNGSGRWIKRYSKYEQLGVDPTPKSKELLVGLSKIHVLELELDQPLGNNNANNYPKHLRRTNGGIAGDKNSFSLPVKKWQNVAVKGVGDDLKTDIKPACYVPRVRDYCSPVD